MTLTPDQDEVLSAALAGVPRVVEFIATVPAEERGLALKAAEKSYLETAHALGCHDSDALQWAEAVMTRLRTEEGGAELRSFSSPPTSPGDEPAADNSSATPAA